MAFNTTSFLAGVGTVVVVLSTGFAGGYMVANPNAPAPPNRLQRLAADNQAPKAATPAPVTAATTKPQIAADAAAAQPAAPAPQPAPAPIESKPDIKTTTTEAKADPQPPVATAVEASAPTSSDKPRPDAKPDVAAAQPANRARATDTRAIDTGAADNRTQDSKGAESKAADRKRSDARKFAEQQRRQRELEVATVAVRRIIHERPPQEVVVDDDQPEASTAPHFSLFGQE